MDLNRKEKGVASWPGFCERCRQELSRRDGKIKGRILSLEAAGFIGSK